MKKSLLILLVAPFLLMGCNPSEQQKQEEQGQEEKPTQESLVGNYTAKIVLSGNDFTVANATGVQFDSNYKDNVDKLTTYCGSKLEYSGLLNSIECRYLNTCEWQPNVALCIGTGYYAKNKFSSGLFKWNSSEKIYKVVLKARAYTKKNDYSGDIVDTPAKVQFDNDAPASLLESGEEAPQVKVLTKEYSEGTTSFSIISKEARVAVESIEITWKR